MGIAELGVKGAHSLGRFRRGVSYLAARRRAATIFQRYAEYTMISRNAFIENLVLCKRRAPAEGCVVECGVWRGGMSAGIADMLPGRRHFLFDSFEGLPPARDIDGAPALAWQADKTSPRYYDNCSAGEEFAQRAMSRSAAREFRLLKGWFEHTLPGFDPGEPIAILRLDGDWYDSTMQCLTNLYPKVAIGGLIIIDDYYTWDGCSRAIHDYLSQNKLTDRIEQRPGFCFWIKRDLEKAQRREA